MPCPESPRLPFLPPIVSMAAQGIQPHSQDPLQRQHQQQRHHTYHLNHHHHQHNQHLQPQQRHQQYHHHHHHPYTPSPRPTQDSTMTLRLGPVARARTFAAESSIHDSSYLPKLGSKVRSRGEGRLLGCSQGSEHWREGQNNYPRIVVKDPLGRSLDTFTTLQEAIYRASWLRKKMGGKCLVVTWVAIGGFISRSSD